MIIYFLIHNHILVSGNKYSYSTKNMNYFLKFLYLYNKIFLLIAYDDTINN